MDTAVGTAVTASPYFTEEHEMLREQVRLSA